MRIVRPPALPPGSTIGVFAPSTPAHVKFAAKYRHGVDVLRRLGYEVVEGPLVASGRTQGYRAGTPQERAAELMALFLDPAVHGVMSVIGGYNSASLVPHLDFDAIRAHPKVFCGYSDVTSLHLALLARAGLSTFYGPAVMPSFGEWPDVVEYTRDAFLDAVWRHREGSRTLRPPDRWSNHFRDALGDGWRTEPRQWNENAGWRVLRAGEARGPLLVANLATMLCAAGTPDWPDLDGAVLLVEDMAAPFGMSERRFRHLERMGVFDRIAALVVGKPEMPDPEGAPFSYEDLVLEVVGPRPYPIVAGFDCGHTVPMLTLGETTPVRLAAEGERDVELVVEAPMVT
jgi:muramoyltetrapeptide carboxypeptidase LdcA involved in peptidoglycan recycling